MSKLRIDVNDLTLGELADVAELLGESLSDAMTGIHQPRAIAAIAVVVKRRTDPGYSLDDAFALRMDELEVIGGEDSPEAPSASSGESPSASLARGESLPAKS